MSEEREYLFWTKCIPARLMIYIAYFFIASKFKYVAAGITWLVAATFLINIVLDIMGKYKYGFFGGRVWWREARVVHVLLWSSAGAWAFVNRSALGSTFLILDVLFAVIIAHRQYRHYG